MPGLFSSMFIYSNRLVTFICLCLLWISWNRCWKMLKPRREFQPAKLVAPRNGAQLEMTEFNSSCSHQGWPKLQFSSLAKPQTMGNQRILIPQLPGLWGRQKPFIPLLQREIFMCWKGFRQNYLKVRNTECQGEDTEIIKSLWAL